MLGTCVRPGRNKHVMCIYCFDFSANDCCLLVTVYVSSKMLSPLNICFSLVRIHFQCSEHQLHRQCKWLVSCILHKPWMQQIYRNHYYKKSLPQMSLLFNGDLSQKVAKKILVTVLYFSLTFEIVRSKYYQ